MQSDKQRLIRAMMRSTNSKRAGLMNIEQFADFTDMSAGTISRKLKKIEIPIFAGKYLIDDLAETLMRGEFGHGKSKRWRDSK